METTEATAAALTLDQRRELCAATVTLDGQPAKVGGARSPFAYLWVLPDGPAHGYSWPTVARIVAAGGRFTS